MDQNNYYSSPAQILPGLIPSFYSYGWILPRAAGGVSVTRFAFGSGTASPGAGWRMATAGLNATVNFGCANGAGTYVTSAAYTIPSLNVPYLVLGCHTGSFLRLWVNGAKVGSDVAIVGYMPDLAAAPGIGNRPTDNTNGRQQLGVAGFGYGPGVPSDAQALTHYQACVAAGDVVNLLADTDRMSFKAQGVAALVTSQIGLLAWSRTGAPTLTTGIAP